MNNKINRLLSISAFAMLIFFTSCTEDEITPPSADSPREIITQTEWTRTAMTVSPGFEDEMGNVYTDVLAIEEACERDNTLNYYEDGSGLYGAGNMKCDGEDDVLYAYNWSLNNDATVITKDGDKLNVLELTDKKMVLQEEVPGSELEYGDPLKVYTLTMTLER